MSMQIPVTHNGETTVIETTAPPEISVSAFHMTDSPDEFTQEIIRQGYEAKPASYGLRLNYDEK